MLSVLLSLNVAAQTESISKAAVRGDCTPPPDNEVAAARGVRQHRLPPIRTNWDANKEYRQLVILFSFKDKDFTMEKTRETYDSIFNVSGYNQWKGPGCIADYFRTQSNGLCNIKFDVYGPYRIDTAAQPYSKPSADTHNYGRQQMITATQLFLAEHPDIDFSQYDWNGDKTIDQVIYVHAGRCGNLGEDSYGHIWPNTSDFSSITTKDGIRINHYSVSSELLFNTISSGIGTICHEYTHCFGLPDIYPTSSNGGYSVVDEWDLMDGGNFTNYGWCPPNFTALEKILLGWQAPIELTAPVTVTGLKPSSDGGDIYRIKHTENEWYLLENRQQEMWDAGLPGKGLVIYHVNYSQSAWTGNIVNTDRKKRRFHLMNADNMDYDAWDDFAIKNDLWYANSDHMNSYYLSTSPYPWSSEETELVNNALTDTSTPASTMYTANDAGSTMLSKPITNIQMSDEGLISFDFMGGTLTVIEAIREKHTESADEWFDLSGRHIQPPSQASVYIRKGADGTMKKVIKK